MIRNLDMTTLRSFLAVAEQGGVTRAANSLNLTQSAVSMQLKRLEEMLGLQLLDRSGRKVALTAAGEQLLGYARRIVQLNDEAMGRLTDKVWEGEIHFGVPHDIIYPVIPRVLKRFSAAFPRVRVNLNSSYSTALLDAFGKGEMDLILTTESVIGPGGETVAEMPLRWYGAPDGEAAKQRPLKLAHCRNCLFRPGAIQALEQAGIKWESGIDSDSDGAILATVSADLAVTAILEGTAPQHLEAVSASAGLPDLGSQNVNMYGGARPRSEIVARLAEMVRSGFCATAPVAAVSQA